MLQLELCLCCVPHALQSATTVTQPKKRVSASTQTETVFPEGSQETVVHFLVQCISMLSINVFDMITAIFSLAKEMLGLIYPFQSVLVVLSQWLFRHSLCLCKLAGWWIQCSRVLYLLLAGQRWLRCQSLHLAANAKFSVLLWGTVLHGRKLW